MIWVSIRWCQRTCHEGTRILTLPKYWPTLIFGFQLPVQGVPCDAKDSLLQESNAIHCYHVVDHLATFARVGNHQCSDS